MDFRDIDMQVKLLVLQKCTLSKQGLFCSLGMFHDSEGNAWQYDPLATILCLYNQGNARIRSVIAQPLEPGG